MLIARRAVRPLQILLVALFIALVGAQALLVVALTELAPTETPELQRFRWTVLVAALLVLACVEVVVVATWRLLGLVRVDKIFSSGSLPWVDAIVGAFAAAWLVLLVAAVPVLLMVVMRALLTQATSLRTDLEAVI